MWLSDEVLAHVTKVTEEPDLSATRYRLLREIGRGGMGTVYAAEDMTLHREVALKVSSITTSADVTERLAREAETLAKLEHPGIVPVHDVGTLPDGRVFYVMKLVRGERLDAWARQKKDVRALVRLVQRVAEAVAFAHASGVIHRDLKPENVMVGAFGEALVMDWGIAKVLSHFETSMETSPARSPEAREGTHDGTVLGTPGFMAPEQARGDVAKVDARTDVYGLGALLRSLLHDHTEVPKPLGSIVTKATRDEPSDRYPTALALAEDLGRFLDAERVLAHPDSLGAKASRFIERNQVVLSLLAAYLVLRVVMILVSK